MHQICQTLFSYSSHIPTYLLWVVRWNDHEIHRNVKVVRMTALFVSGDEGKIQRPQWRPGHSLWQCSMHQNSVYYECFGKIMINWADSRLASSQWETPLQSNAVSHWMGANPESALVKYQQFAAYPTGTSTQCPAVMTQYGLMMDAPQLCWPYTCRDTCHGYLPGGFTSMPLMMLGKRAAAHAYTVTKAIASLSMVATEMGVVE